MANYTPIELAEAFIHMGELADALEALNPHLEANPNDATALRLRAALLMRLPGEGHARAALADLEKLIPKTADDYIQQSVIMQVGLGDWLQAVNSTEQAHQLAPDNDRISERLLLLYDQVGELDKARTLLGTLPRTWRWLQLAGDLAQKAHEPETAIEYYSEALILLADKLDTATNPMARNIMGIMIGSRAAAHFEAGHVAAAETDYRVVAELFPTDLSYRLMVGISLALQNKLEEAASLCQRVLAEEPSLETILRERATVYPGLERLLERLGL